MSEASFGVEVLVWRHGHGSPFGHAAIALDVAALTEAQGYLSFHPSAEGLRKLLPNAPVFRSRQEDYEEYRKNKLFDAVLYGLDVEAMRKRYRAWRAGHPTFSAARCCSWLVHHLLEAGGGDEYASWLSSWVIGQWSPDDVKDYAGSIVQHTEKKFGSFTLSTY